MNASAPLVVQFWTEWFSVSALPTRVASDDAVVAAVPLYVPSGDAQITSGNVRAALPQRGESTAAKTLATQDLPRMSSYETRRYQRGLLRFPRNRDRPEN